MKIRNIHIEDYKVFNDFDIDFTHEDEPLDLIVLAGINGSGKSTLLEYIYFMTTIKNVPFSENEYIKGDVLDEQSGRVVQIKFKGAMNPVERTVFIGDKKEESFDDFKKSNQYVYSLSQYGLNKNFANEALLWYIDKLIYEKDIKSSEVYKKVGDRLNSIFDGFDLQVEFNMLDKDRNIFFKNERSDKISIDELSGGEKELITKAFTLYISDLNDKVILIDEPESSLHPKWQNRILKIYEDFARENNNQIIIATHSPHIIASAKKESLRLLIKRDDKIEVISDFEGSYGYEFQRVLLEIMDMDALRVPVISDEIEELYNLVRKNQYDTEEFIFLQQKMENLLGKGDRDIMIIRLEVAKRRNQNEKDQ